MSSANIWFVLMLTVLGKSKGNGFNLFFETDETEVQNVPIHFADPLPAWLVGTMIRNGLGRFEMGKRNFTHAFDGFAKLHSWKFPGNGSAFFSARFVYSDFYKDSVELNDIAAYLLFQTVTPPFDSWQEWMALWRGIDNMNVNVYRFSNGEKNEFYILNDFWKIYQINGTDLSTVRWITPPHPARSLWSYGAGFGFLDYISSSHPLPEYGTSNFLTFLSSVSLIPGINSRMSLIRIVSGDERETIASWKIVKVPYMHSFSATENYAILFAIPFYVNVMDMLFTAQPFDSLDWYGDEQTTIYIVHLQTGQVTELTTENVFTMHHVNAFELNSFTIVVDLSTYPNPDFIAGMELQTLRDPVRRNQFPTKALLKRFQIDLSTKRVTKSLFNTSSVYPYTNMLDMPTINENYRYKSYRHVYGLVLKIDDVNLNHIAIVKKDLTDSNNDKVWFEKDNYPTEAWFVSRPGATEEDDGVLLVPILDGVRRKSYFAVIDARTMTTITTADLPCIIPFGLHGRLFPDLI